MVAISVEQYPGRLDRSRPRHIDGAIVGPLLGGALLGINLPLQLNFIAFAVPGVIAALAMAVFAISSKRSGTPAPVVMTAAAKA